MAYSVGFRLPPDNAELVRRLSLRWMRAAGPHNEWAKLAKTCTEFLEGQQWSPEAKAEMRGIKRSALTINKINPLYRLVMGYQSSNRLDINFLPTSDSVSSEDLAKVLTALQKIESGRIDLKYIDSEVFGDGLTTGRGFWDLCLDFQENDFGEVAARAADPFSKFLDPDGNQYDLENSCNYITDSVWTDTDEINSLYGSDAAMAVQDIMSPSFTSELSYFLGEQDISPKRFFGQYADDKAMGNWNDVYHTDFIDRQAKRIRLMDTQYKIVSVKPCFVDLETGDKEPVPDDWLKPENQHRIEKSLAYAEKLGNPLKIVNRPVKRVRRTVSCADVLLFDRWSSYESYTTIGFFPYFRRGVTRGMIEDLIDPQMEINKKRSVIVDILNRNANSGWIYEENSLDPEQEENLKRYGSAPGINVKWKRSMNTEAPKRIEPGQYPQGLDKLEMKAQLDLNQISGINESAMGQLDTVQSGRAIEARQRQAVLSIQMYQDNFSRSKKQQGRKFLEIYQNHYTEERIYRDIGEDSKMVIYEINKKIATGANSMTRMNDITVGKYSVEVDEVPISATFKQGQFEETMMILEKLGPIGMALAQSSPQLIIEQTSLPRKQDWIDGLMNAAAAVPPGTQPGAPPAEGTPVGPAAGTPEGFAS